MNPPPAGLLTYMEGLRRHDIGMIGSTFAPDLRCELVFKRHVCVLTGTGSPAQG